LENNQEVIQVRFQIANIAKSTSINSLTLDQLKVLGIHDRMPYHVDIESSISKFNSTWIIKGK